MVKNGGNVVSYFCTPDGRLIHAVGGPVSGKKLLTEAKWAKDLADDLQNSTGISKAEFLREAHRSAAQPGRSHSGWDSNRASQANVHRMLTQYAYMPMSDVETKLFRSLSGEKFESDRSEILDASDAFAVAEKRKRLVFLVLRAKDSMTSAKNRWQKPSNAYSVLNDYKVKRHLKKFVVASLPKIQLAAFTNLKELNGWEELAVQAGSNWRAEHTFLIVHPSGKILAQLDPDRPKEFQQHLKSTLDSWDEERAKIPGRLVASNLHQSGR